MNWDRLLTLPAFSLETWCFLWRFLKNKSIFKQEKSITNHNIYSCGYKNNINNTIHFGPYFSIASTSTEEIHSFDMTLVCASALNCPSMSVWRQDANDGKATGNSSHNTEKWSYLWEEYTTLLKGLWIVCVQEIFWSLPLPAGECDAL